MDVNGGPHKQASSREARGLEAWLASSSYLKRFVHATKAGVHAP